MATLLSFGEILIDFLPDEAGANYRPIAGGAPANVAVGFSKLGGISYFAGGISKDNFGKFLLSELEHYKVKTDWIKQTEQKTALAVVSLDDSGERDFNFYRDNTADLAYTAEDIDNIKFGAFDILHFCSNTLTEASSYQATLYALEKAKSHQRMICFDANLRQDLWDDTSLIAERVFSVLCFVEILKVSKEELDWLATANHQSKDEFYTSAFKNGIKIIVITDGPNDIVAVTKDWQISVTPPSINAVDTTAAGDSFIAGFLYCINEQIPEECIIRPAFAEPGLIEQALKFAAQCSAITCSDYGAFPALPTRSDIK